jgi:DNA-binding NarL/FixJ family response regulator
VNKTTRIVLADDHSLVRDGIRALLEEDENYVVIGEVSNGLEAVQMVLEKKPDLLIIDIRMPKMNGIEAVEELKNHASPTKCIILSMHDSEEYILKSVSAGANGYLLKDTGKTEFLKAISTVEQGGKYFSGDISNVLVNNLLSQGQAKQESHHPITNGNNTFGITSKELQILELVLSGLTNKQISEKLQKSKRTIETHRFNLMRKMGVNNLMDLAKKAQEFKLV